MLQFLRFCTSLQSQEYPQYNSEVEQEVFNFYVLKRPQNVNYVFKELVEFFEGASSKAMQIEFVLTIIQVLRDYMQAGLKIETKSQVQLLKIQWKDTDLLPDLCLKILRMCDIESLHAFLETSSRQWDIPRFLENVLLLVTKFVEKQLKDAKPFKDLKIHTKSNSTHNVSRTKQVQFSVSNAKVDKTKPPISAQQVSKEDLIKECLEKSLQESKMLDNFVQDSFMDSQKDPERIRSPMNSNELANYQSSDSDSMVPSSQMPQFANSLNPLRPMDSLESHRRSVMDMKKREMQRRQALLDKFAALDRQKTQSNKPNLPRSQSQKLPVVKREESQELPTLPEVQAQVRDERSSRCLRIFKETNLFLRKFLSFQARQSDRIRSYLVKLRFDQCLEIIKIIEGSAEKFSPQILSQAYMMFQQLFSKALQGGQEASMSPEFNQKFYMSYVKSTILDKEPTCTSDQKCLLMCQLLKSIRFDPEEQGMMLDQYVKSLIDGLFTNGHFKAK